MWLGLASNSTVLRLSPDKNQVVSCKQPQPEARLHCVHLRVFYSSFCLSLTDLREIQGLFRSVFLEVDPSAQPVVIPFAQSEALDPVHKSQRGSDASAMVAHHRPVIIVKTGH